jgi:hypothetical protein
MNELFSKIIHISRLIVLLGILSLTVWHIITNAVHILNFLTISILLVIFSLFNIVDDYLNRDVSWLQYSLLLFSAMIFGSVGDFLMAGIFYITPIRLINGVIFFGIGHIFYLFALRNRSPLLLRKLDISEVGQIPRLIKRNLIVWLSCIAAVVILFYFTVFDPTNLALNIGLFAYGILLVSVLAFALTKWFGYYSLYFRISISLGFFFFLFSDWLIGVRNTTNPNFMSPLVVGVTYIVGQLLIQLTGWNLLRKMSSPDSGDA